MATRPIRTTRPVASARSGEIRPTSPALRPIRRERESGSATVWTVVLALLPLCLAMAVLAFAAAVGTRHRAATAADAAALAAAARADLGTGEACAAARGVAARQGASVIECVVRDGFADVTAQSSPPPLLRPFGPARVAARAGPG